MIHVAIIEDNEDALYLLEFYITKYFQNYKILFKCASLEDAVTNIKIDEIDLLFLDIGLAERSGFDFLDLYPNKKFQTIITSGTEKHAINATQFNVIDYLLKPLSIVDFKKALLRFEQKINKTETIEIPKNEYKPAEVDLPLILKTHSHTYVIPRHSISYIEANGPYSTIFQNGRQIVCSKTALALENEINSSIFFRCSRSSLINLSAIIEIAKLPDRTFEVRFKDGSKLAVSEPVKQSILSQMELLNK